VLSEPTRSDKPCLSDKVRVHTGLGNAKMRLDWTLVIPYTCVAFTDNRWEKDEWPVFLHVHCSDDMITASDVCQIYTMCCTCTLGSLHEYVFLQALRFLTPHNVDLKLFWHKTGSMPLASQHRNVYRLFDSTLWAAARLPRGCPKLFKALMCRLADLKANASHFCANMAVHYKEMPTRLIRKAQWLTTKFCLWSAFMAVLYW